jgi:hypothetical protein
MIAVGQNIMPLKSTGTKYLTAIPPISSLAFLTLWGKKIPKARKSHFMHA